MKNEQNSKNICFGDLGIIEIAKKVQRKKVFSLDLSAAKWPSCITVVWGESAPLPISLTGYNLAFDPSFRSICCHEGCTEGLKN